MNSSNIMQITDYFRANMQRNQKGDRNWEKCAHMLIHHQKLYVHCTSCKNAFMYNMNDMLNFLNKCIQKYLMSSRSYAVGLQGRVIIICECVVHIVASHDGITV